MIYYIFFFKQKTAYEMRISDWSSDVCSSDLRTGRRLEFPKEGKAVLEATRRALAAIEDIRRVVPEQDGKAMLRTASFTSMAAGLSSILERFLPAPPTLQVQVIHVQEQETWIEQHPRTDIEVA